MQEAEEKYIHRAIQQARAGLGYTAPNPMVGAVLVCDNRIIGEGYHQKYGEAHAEVNCINSVRAEDKALISQSTLYVTLEPCSHFGKTPPCADLIIRESIPKVVIGSVDPFPKVSGSGIEKLKQAGVEVITGILEKECSELNKRFFTFHKKKRPYIILKWAQSLDEYISLPDKSPVKISNFYTDRIVHRWRSEEMAILAGSQTALSDNPKLTNRLWTGKSPKRLVIDRRNKLPDNIHLLSDTFPTLIFNLFKEEQTGNKEWIKINKANVVLEQMMDILFQKNIQSVLVEGGATLLQAFINKGLWDEARIITGQNTLYEGTDAPHLTNCTQYQTKYIEGDKIEFYKPFGD